MAALAGVDLNVAKAGLVNLANIVGGDLEVSNDGKSPPSPLMPLAWHFFFTRRILHVPCKVVRFAGKLDTAPAHLESRPRPPKGLGWG